MASLREILLGIIMLLSVPISVFALQQIGAIKDLASVNDQIIAAVFAGIVLAAIGLIADGARRKKEGKTRTKVNVINPTQKKSLFSKLRFSIREEKRMGFWMVATTGIIFGPTMMLIMLSFPEPVLPQKLLEYYFTKILAIVGGLTYAILGFLIASNLILDTWESKRRLAVRRQNAYAKTIKDFDNAFDAVQTSTHPYTKTARLSDFKSQLFKLSKYEWNQVNDRITKVLDNLIPDKIAEDTLNQQYIQILVIIFERFKPDVINIVRKKWMSELEKIYSNFNYDSEHTENISHVFNMLQEMQDYREDYLEKLVDDALNQWSKLKFDLLVSNIGFGKLRTIDEMAYKRVLQYICREMNLAAQNNKEQDLKRLETIYRVAQEA